MVLHSDELNKGCDSVSESDSVDRGLISNL